MFATTLENGMCQASPDTCLTPAPPPVNQAPVPYINYGFCPTAKSDTCSSRVLINGQKTFTLKTVIPHSQGDEAGSLGGIISKTYMGEVGYLQGSKKVLVEGTPAVYCSNTTRHNGFPPNVNGSQVSPSQRKVDLAG
jgi:hypothetical protein